MTADYPDYQTPQAHATAIAGTGVGLLKFLNLIKSGVATTVPAASTSTLQSLAVITQPSWEFGATLWLPSGAGTAPWCRWSLDWFDPSGAVHVASDNVETALGNGSANPISITGRGPCKGGTLTLKLQNADPAQILTTTFDVHEASHTFERTSFEQTALSATPPIGFLQSGADPGQRIACWTKPSITVGTPQSRLLPVMFGKWRITIDNSGQASALTVQIQTVTGITIAAASNVYNNQTAAGAVTEVEVNMPAGPMLMVMTNNGASGTITPTIMAIFEPY